MLSSTADLKVLLVQRTGGATIYVPNPEKAGGIFPVRLVQSDEDHLQKAVDQGLTLAIVDAASLGTHDALEALEFLGRTAAEAPLIAWVEREADAGSFKGENMTVIRRPDEFRRRYVQMGRIVSVCLRSDRAALERIAVESFGTKS